MPRGCATRAGAAGLCDKSYRRARQALLDSGELILLSCGGGRGNANRWQIPDLRRLAARRSGLSGTRRIAPTTGARPLLASVPTPASPTSQKTSPARVELGPVQAEDPGQDRTLSAGNPGQDRTLFAETPAQTPAQTTAPTARAGREPLNPRTREHPPNPPHRGRSGTSVTIEETYTSPHGRKRRRRVKVDLDEVRRELGIPTASDHAAWVQIRKLLAQAVGQDTFAVWFASIELIAIDSDGALVLDARVELRGWLHSRFSRVIADTAQAVGRVARIADATQSAAIGAS